MDIKQPIYKQHVPNGQTWAITRIVIDILLHVAT
jgi:hypothetical protein